MVDEELWSLLGKNPAIDRSLRIALRTLRGQHNNLRSKYSHPPSLVGSLRPHRKSSGHTHSPNFLRAMNKTGKCRRSRWQAKFPAYFEQVKILSDMALHAAIACDFQPFALLDWSTCGRTAGDQRFGSRSVRW